MPQDTPTITIEEADTGSSASAAAHTGSPSLEDTGNGAAINIGELQSSDQAALLSAIDRLRREHINTDISIPQIVVCGDQSSGKSSVLEAIAGVPFPISATTTTRFATEVILRHALKDDIQVRVIASPDREPDMRRKIEDFHQSFVPSGTQDFGRLIEQAGRHLQSIEPGNKFWKDWLRVEVSGPRQPHLTLVDLPGIIQYESPENAAKGDKERIKQLVMKYLQDPRTIVLAIVDAQNNLENQEIIGLARQTAKNRTLGVITKPDRLISGSDLEQNAISIAKNETLQLGLRWHVLSNLPHEDTDRSPLRRDEMESQFFANSEWSQLNRRDVGVSSLRKKLSEQLFKRIAADLPDLVSEMRKKLRHCKIDLDRLGPARTTTTQQRAYLSKVFNTLRRLIEDALEGDYHKKEFESFFDGSVEKGLRDRITNATVEFASEMRKMGKQFMIWDNNREVPHNETHDDLEEASIDDDLDEASIHELNFFAPFVAAESTDESGQGKLWSVSLEVYCEALAKYMQETRGKGLPGMISTKTVQAVFRQLSVPWDNITDRFTTECFDATFTFLKLAIKHVAGHHTGEALLRAYVYPGSHGDGFDSKRVLLDAKAKELLWPYKECHPMTYNPRYNAGSCDQSNPDVVSGPKKWADIAREGDFESEHIDAADALDQTESYYDIALATFIENVASLGIERCLLNDLSNIIPPSDATDMYDAKVAEIAGEPPAVYEERAKAEAQAKALEEVIRVCRPYTIRNTAMKLPVSDLSPDPRTSLEVGKQRSSSAPGERSTSVTQTPSAPSLFMGTSAMPGTGLLGARTDVPASESTTLTATGKSQTVIATAPHSNSAAGSSLASASNSERPLSSLGQGTEVFGSNKTAGSVTPFAGFGGQTAATSTDSSTFASGSGLFNAKTNTNNKSGGFGSNVTGDGKSVFGSTSVFSQPAKPAASTDGLFGSTSPFGQRATPAASTGGFGFGKPQTDPIDRPRSTGSNPFGSGGSKNSNANGEGPTSGKSQVISYYTPTEGTGGWIFKAFDCDGLHEDYPEGFIRIWGPRTNDGFYQSLTAHKRFSLSSFEELRLDDYNSGRSGPFF